MKGARPGRSQRDLRTIESFFREHGSPTVTIEVAPWPVDDVSQLRLSSGYAPSGTEDVVVATAASCAEPIQSGRDLDRRRLEPLMLTGGEEAPSPLTRHLIAVAARLPNARNYAVFAGGQFIAGAQAVLYQDFAIFGNDETKPEARRRGAQAALIAARLGALPPGTAAVAQVAPGSGSERNYLRGGFTPAYNPVSLFARAQVNRPHRRLRNEPLRTRVDRTGPPG